MTVRFNTGLPATETLSLQCCGQCGHVNYPPRELCGNCLADALAWHPVDDGGIVQAKVKLHYSLEQEYALHLPWPVASVRLDCGAIVLAHLQAGVETGSRTKIRVARDGVGNRMLVATGTDQASQQALSSWLETIEFTEVST